MDAVLVVLHRVAHGLGLAVVFHIIDLDDVVALAAAGIAGGERLGVGGDIRELVAVVLVGGHVHAHRQAAVHPDGFLGHRVVPGHMDAVLVVLHRVAHGLGLAVVPHVGQGDGRTAGDGIALFGLRVDALECVARVGLLGQRARLDLDGRVLLVDPRLAGVGLGVRGLLHTVHHVLYRVLRVLRLAVIPHIVQDDGRTAGDLVALFGLRGHLFKRVARVLVRRQGTGFYLDGRVLLVDPRSALIDAGIVSLLHTLDRVLYRIAGVLRLAVVPHVGQGDGRAAGDGIALLGRRVDALESVACVGLLGQRARLDLDGRVLLVDPRLAGVGLGVCGLLHAVHHVLYRIERVLGLAVVPHIGQGDDRAAGDGIALLGRRVDALERVARVGLLGQRARLDLDHGRVVVDPRGVLVGLAVADRTVHLVLYRVLRRLRLAVVPHIVQDDGRAAGDGIALFGLRGHLLELVARVGLMGQRAVFHHDGRVRLVDPRGALVGLGVCGLLHAVDRVLHRVGGVLGLAVVPHIGQRDDRAAGDGIALLGLCVDALECVARVGLLGQRARFDLDGRVLLVDPRRAGVGLGVRSLLHAVHHVPHRVLCRLGLAIVFHIGQGDDRAAGDLVALLGRRVDAAECVARVGLLGQRARLDFDGRVRFIDPRRAGVGLGIADLAVHLVLHRILRRLGLVVVPHIVQDDGRAAGDGIALFGLRGHLLELVARVGLMGQRTRLDHDGRVLLVDPRGIGVGLGVRGLLHTLDRVLHRVLGGLGLVVVPRVDEDDLVGTGRHRDRLGIAVHLVALDLDGFFGIGLAESFAGLRLGGMQLGAGLAALAVLHRVAQIAARDILEENRRIPGGHRRGEGAGRRVDCFVVGLQHADVLEHISVLVGLCLEDRGAEQGRHLILGGDRRLYAVKSGIDVLDGQLKLFVVGERPAGAVAAPDRAGHGVGQLDVVARPGLGDGVAGAHGHFRDLDGLARLELHLKGIFSKERPLQRLGMLCAGDGIADGLAVQVILAVLKLHLERELAVSVLGQAGGQRLGKAEIAALDAVDIFDLGLAGHHVQDALALAGRILFQPCLKLVGGEGLGVRVLAAGHFHLLQLVLGGQVVDDLFSVPHRVKLIAELRRAHQLGAVGLLVQHRILRQAAGGHQQGAGGIGHLRHIEAHVVAFAVLVLIGQAGGAVQGHILAGALDVVQLHPIGEGVFLTLFQVSAGIPFQHTVLEFERGLLVRRQRFAVVVIEYGRADGDAAHVLEIHVLAHRVGDHAVVDQLGDLGDELHKLAAELVAAGLQRAAGAGKLREEFLRAVSRDVHRHRIERKIRVAAVGVFDGCRLIQRRLRSVGAITGVIATPVTDGAAFVIGGGAAVADQQQVLGHLVARAEQAVGMAQRLLDVGAAGFTVNSAFAVVVAAGQGPPAVVDHAQQLLQRRLIRHQRAVLLFHQIDPAGGQFFRVAREVDHADARVDLVVVQLAQKLFHRRAGALDALDALRARARDLGFALLPLDVLVGAGPFPVAPAGVAADLPAPKSPIGLGAAAGAGGGIGTRHVAVVAAVGDRHGFGLGERPLETSPLPVAVAGFYRRRRVLIPADRLAALPTLGDLDLLHHTGGGVQREDQLHGLALQRGAAAGELEGDLILVQADLHGLLAEGDAVLGDALAVIDAGGGRLVVAARCDRAEQVQRQTGRQDGDRQQGAQKLFLHFFNPFFT